MAGGTSPLACQFRMELARRAEFDVIGKQLLVCRVRAAFDNDVVGLQLEPGHVHESVLDAASKQGSERDCDKGENPASHRPADTWVHPQRRHVEIITILKLPFEHCMFRVYRGFQRADDNSARCRCVIRVRLEASSRRSGLPEADSTWRRNPAVDLLQMQ